MKYLSRVDFLFNPHIGRNRTKGHDLSEKKHYLNSLPWIIKQTLFLENDMLKALRDVPDVGYLIFVTDDTKIKGNRAYDQGNYYEALDIYE